MAINNDRNLLEQQILSNSGLKGKELENLKARLATLSEQQLQAELSKSLSGNNKGEWYTGVMLEHNESVVMRNNHDQTTYTDDNGNEISELKDGDEVLERTIKSTDDKGNTFEITVTFSGGRPLTQIKSKNGNTTETTTYKYNDDADVPFVTVETKKADQSKVTTNVLEVDNNGNFDNEDFIDRKTTLLDGTEIFVTKENGRLTENVKKVGKPEVTTVYNGDNIQDLDSKKLNRLKQNDVYYDGKGNTYVQVNAGETAQIMADRINKKRTAGQPQVTAQQIIELNPNLVKKNGEFVLQKFENGVKGLGEVKVPGEFDANSPFIRTRQSIQKANNLANQAEIDKQIATKVTETTDKKFAAELANNGFKPTRENAIFYNKFNALNPTQQQNVLSVIKYCKSQNITDPNKIKARILETFPEVNLFDSGKTIPQTNNNVPLFQRKNPVALETFLTETLKLDLKSETGAMVYEKLSSLPQEALNKINAQNFVDLSKANFVEIAHRFEANGVDIRTGQEHQIENNSPRMKAEQERKELRESASQNIALAYDNAINIIKQYQGNQGWINVGFYREKLGKLLSNVNPTKINTCFDDVIKELEKEKKFAVGYLKGKSTNDKEFKEAFKKVSGGVEYNEANMKAFLDVAQDPKANFEDEKYNEKFWNAYNKAFGIAKTDKNGKVYYEPQVVKQATSRTNFQQYVDGAGDIVLMLLGTEAIGKGVAWAGGKLVSKVSPYVPKFLANAGSKTVMTIGSNNITVGRVAANMASQSASFTLWDASKNYINLKTKDIQYTGEAAEKEWEAYKEGNVESAKFGAFAGALNTTVVGKVINGTMKMFEKPIAKAVSKVSKSFETTSAMTGADVMKTFMLNQTPGMLAKTAGTIAEIGGFTLYETANEVVEELLKKGEDGHLPAELTENGLTSYLLDKLGGQAKNLGEIKAISRLMFMHKGAIKEQARLMDENLAKCETLKNVQIKKTEVNGREIFEVTMPDGNRKVANSVEEVIANCNVLMQLDVISNAAKENETEGNKNTPQGMNAQEDALIQKARKENPATVVEEKVRRQWQQSDSETPVPEVKVDLFNLDPNAGLKESAQNVENEVTSLIFKGKLNETLTQRYNEMGKVFTEIAQRRSADIEELVKANPKDKQAVADGIVKILAQELGMEGFEPPIVFENTNGGDGFADWPNGRIVVNKDITNVKKLASMISHEFVHMLQYRDVLAQYGEQGLRELIANDKSIPEDKKESYIKNALENDYNKHLLQSYNFQKAQIGTVNDYLRRIYKDEFTNTVGTENMPRYVDQATERGAYSSQEKVDRGLDESNLGELSVGEYVPNDASLAALRAKMKAKLQAGQDVSSNNPLNRTSESTEDFELNPDGTVTRKGVPAGINDEEQFKQRKEDLINQVRFSNLASFNESCASFINDIKPENFDAALEVFEYSKTKVGMKIFPGGISVAEIMGNIKKENLGQFKDMTTYLETKSELPNDAKECILYNVARGDFKPETIKSLLEELDSKDVAKIDGITSVLYFGAEGKQLEAMLEFYREIKTGKYDNIIDRNKVIDHMTVIDENNIKSTIELLNTFANEAVPSTWFDQVLVGVQDADMAKDTEVSAIVDLYNASKNYLGEGTLPDPIIFRRLKSDDVPSKVEILNMIKNSGAQQGHIDGLINKTNKNNIDIAKEFAQKAFIKKEIPANNVSVILTRLNSKTNPLDINFVRENLDYITSAEWDIVKNITPNNINLAKVISDNKNIPGYAIRDLLEHAVDKTSEANLIKRIDDGVYERPEVEVMSELKNEYIKIIRKYMKQDYLKEAEEFYKNAPEKFENEVLLGHAYHLKDVKLTDEENAIVQKILNTKTAKYNFDSLVDDTSLAKAGRALQSYSERRNKLIYDMRYAIENSRFLHDDKIKPQDVIAQFNEELYPILTNNELGIVKDIFVNESSEAVSQEKRFSADFYKLLKKRNIIPLLENNNVTRNTPEREHVMELLNCTEDEFATKRDRLNKRHELHTVWSTQVPTFTEWKRLLNMSDSEYDALKVPFALRTETPVDIEAYEKEITARMNQPVTYDPIEASRVIARAEARKNSYRTLFEDEYRPAKLNPFEKLPKKEDVQIDPLQSTTSLMTELRENKHVIMSIPNEGGVKVKPYDAIIHPKDEPRIGIEEEAGMSIHYGKKLQWSNFKIARDILQNYYDGHGHTLEGVNVEVIEIDGKYKVKVSGESTWDYAHLDEVGSSTKEGDFYDAGGYGEGTRAVAVSLLSKLGTTDVKYSSGDWTVTYKRSSDDLSSAFMTQTLTRNNTKLKGSTVEFETDNIDLVKKVLEAKDYFNQPHNPDFKNFDFENDFFGIKFKSEGQGGNIYLIQRYESNGLHSGGVEGATIVFKTKPDHPTLVEKDGADFKLGTGADRAQIPAYDINRILSRYVKTMTDEELTQMISSMENMWRVDLDKKADKQVYKNDLFKPFIEEAKRRSLGIDFGDSHYVYIAKNEPEGNIEMARILGYKLATEDMKDVGMQSFASVDTSKMPHQPTEIQSKQIRLLEEGIRILQECTDFDTKDLLNKDEVEKPTYMFSEGDLGAGAEAIIENGKYEGHWMRDSHLFLQDYVGNLATFLHEISHKSGGDTSSSFSNQLIKLQTHIVNVLTKNPNALAKFRTLAKMYNGVRKTEIKDLEDTVITNSDFTAENYKTSMQEQLEKPYEYTEYVEEVKKEVNEFAEAVQKLNDAGIEYDNGNIYKIENGVRIKLDLGDIYDEMHKPNKHKLTTFAKNFAKTKFISLGGIKKYTKSFINRLFGRNKSQDNTINVMEFGGIISSSSVPKIKIPDKESLKYDYTEYSHSDPEIFTTLPTGEAMMQHLNGTGHVELSIPNSGGLAPKISEFPPIENDPNLNKTVLAKMKIKYAEKRDWSNEKVARDIMQNFYDGNGHTLEGVKISANRQADGTYTIRIDGQGVYNYIYLNRLGGSDKFDPKDAGGFGEGSRVVAASLLAKGTNRVRFSCKDWQVDFTNSNPENIDEASMLRTLTKPDKIVDGNYIEFDTKDEDLVRQIMESKNYFYNPHNPDFKNLDVENEFFGFKVTPSQNGNVYYIQRYQTPDKKMEGGLQDMTLTFKQAAFGPEFEDKVGFRIDLNTTRDRMALEAPQIYDLGRAYAKTLSNTDLIKAISALEPILTSSYSEDLKFKRINQEKDNLSYKFACAIRQEAISRGIEFNFGGKKIVAVDKKSEYERNLDSEEEQFFKDQGYIFCDELGCPLGIEKAHDIYEKLHRPHSVEPTNIEAKKLQIIDEAIKIIAKQDKYGLFPDLSDKKLYIFDKTSNIKGNATFHAVVKDGNYDGLFINREKLGNTGFTNMVTEAIAEMLEIHGKKKTANYSYNLTDLIRSELNAFISNPETAEKFKILEDMYNNTQ